MHEERYDGDDEDRDRNSVNDGGGERALVHCRETVEREARNA